MKIVQLDHGISDKERADILFAGDLLVYRQRPSMIKLIEFTKEMLQQQFGQCDYTQIQNDLARQPYLEQMGEVQTRFRNSESARQLFFSALKECGVDLDKTYYDHFPLRVVPFSDQHLGAQRAAIGHHRDTWGSNIDCQINWWAPIFSLTEERTIAIYPQYWDKPLANNTESWSFSEFLKTRNDTQNERQVAYPSAPTPSETVDESGVVKVVIAPGDVLNFASAHLHASVPNTTDSARFSIEMRTVNSDFLIADLKSPNFDNAATKPMYQWFKNIVSKQALKP